MRVAFPQFPSNARALRRTGILVLVVAVHLLLLLLLLRLAPPLDPPPAAPSGQLTITLIPEARTEQTRTRAARARRAASAPAKKAAAAPVPPAVQPPPPPSTSNSAAIWSQVVPMSREQLAAADLARIPSPPTAQAGTETGDTGAATGEDSGDPGPGAGPNGEPLYNAQWQRRPTHAELDFYMPSNRPRSGYGMVACKTVPGFRVEDCREIDQSPGSGLARAVRLAAWQFRVLPPRIGGRAMVGAWVRIRIDYTTTGPE